MKLARLLMALGIRHVGEVTAEALAAHFNTLEELGGASEERLAGIAGIGVEVAASLHRFFQDPATALLLQRFAAVGLRIRLEERQEERSGLSGRVFLFTGSLAMSRNEAKQMARSAGAQVASSLSRRVTDLVVGASPGGKLAEAERLGIPTMTEAAFLDLMRQAPHGP